MIHRTVQFAVGWAVILGLVLAVGEVGYGQAKKQDAAQAKRRPRKPQPFRWVNPLKQEYPGVRHATFRSSSMKRDVGYCIYLPPAYGEKSGAARRFPVVYYLHGGRPGSEIKSVRLAEHFHKHIKSGQTPPVIYVFVNGGPVSHYNLPDREQAMGEDVFVKELIPHVDKTYRTISDRRGRGLEGFSQGGRGTTRIMFKHPHLFCSAAPGGAGHSTEKRISEENGRENDNLVFAPGYNTWDLARKYARRPTPALRIMIHVGDKGFNYQNNLEYMTFLDSLKISYQRIVVAGVPHSAGKIYEKQGLALMRFHAESFRLSGAIEGERSQ
ncbi:MAG: alpha/beta hydrolase-fold protein [Pirellulaceae bacterium]|jgi:endo-1,4-beta-xylanase|nr:alpha/beta hydrolase-fold protein [Pirellulaceae bacterium]MDP7019785.1 alpha/beta hydrolase-fold protein [Pirellulaceae bacterium]